MLHQAFFINHYLFALFPFLLWFFCVIFPVEDQPDVDHLGLRHWRHLLDLACEDGRQHQHEGQVHRKTCLKVDWLEEGGGVHDHQQEQGEHVGDKHLRLDLTLHVHLLFAIVKPEVIFV